MFDYEPSFDDALYEHFTRKESAEFWKCWNRKFRRNASINKLSHINRIQGNVDIANEFAKSFSGLYYDSNSDSHAVNEFYDVCESTGQVSLERDETIINNINVELIDVFTRLKIR